MFVFTENIMKRLVLSSYLRLAVQLLNTAHATCPLNLIFLNFILVITFGDEH